VDPIDSSLPPAQTSVSSGVKGKIKFGGSQGGFLALPGDLPPDLLAKYASTSTISVLRYFFKGCFNKCVDGVGEGNIIARACGNAAQASLSFVYKWCGPGALDDRFTVSACTFNGLRFTVIDDTTWISEIDCQDSIVVLGVEQFCGATQDSIGDAGCRYQSFPCISKPAL